MPFGMMWPRRFAPSTKVTRSCRPRWPNGSGNTHRADLTEREIEVLTHMMDGLSNKEIAGAIGRTEATVKAHLLNVFEKLGASDRTEAVTIALRRGIVHLPDK